MFDEVAEPDRDPDLAPGRRGRLCLPVPGSRTVPVDRGGSASVLVLFAWLAGSTPARGADRLHRADDRQRATDQDRQRDVLGEADRVDELVGSLDRGHQVVEEVARPPVDEPHHARDVDVHRGGYPARDRPRGRRAGSRCCRRGSGRRCRRVRGRTSRSGCRPRRRRPATGRGGSARSSRRPARSPDGRSISTKSAVNAGNGRRCERPRASAASTRPGASTRGGRYAFPALAVSPVDRGRGRSTASRQRARGSSVAVGQSSITLAEHVDDRRAS